MGVTDVEFIMCLTCHRHTAHITDWESETPDKLFVQCLEHEYHGLDVKVTLAGV